jgi:glycosyltransferase involved in cell wall biosynthesis
MKSGNNILFLIPGFPKDENDFLCIPPVQDFLLKYLELNPETSFYIITFQYPYEKIKYNWNGTSVYALGGKNSDIKKLFVWKNSIEIAKRIHKDNNIDCVHSFWYGECALVGNYLSKRFKCDHICTLMGQDVHTSNHYMKFINDDRVKIIALSQNQSDEFYRISNRKVDGEIFWGIENQNYNVNSKREIDLLAVGSLTPLKNYSLFIKTIAGIANIYPDVVCKLVGQGPELTLLKILVKELNLEKNIEITGLLSRKEIFKLMLQSKIFVHPSKSEGAGFVFAEALANGMNVVSFNVGYAKPCEKWLIAKDENEFIFLVNKLLSAKLSFEPLNIFPVSETVTKYNHLYNLNRIQ